jgi:hypothetical protein
MTPCITVSTLDIPGTGVAIRDVGEVDVDRLAAIEAKPVQRRRREWIRGAPRL